MLLIGLMVVGCIDNNGGDPIGRLGDRQIEGRELHNGDNQRERRGKGKTEGKGNRREGRDLLLSSWETEIGGRGVHNGNNQRRPEREIAGIGREIINKNGME